MKIKRFLGFWATTAFCMVVIGINFFPGAASAKHQAQYCPKPAEGATMLIMGTNPDIKEDETGYVLAADFDVRLPEHPVNTAEELKLPVGKRPLSVQCWWGALADTKRKAYNADLLRVVKLQLSRRNRNQLGGNAFVQAMTEAQVLEALDATVTWRDILPALRDRGNDSRTNVRPEYIPKHPSATKSSKPKAKPKAKTTAAATAATQDEAGPKPCPPPPQSGTVQ